MESHISDGKMVVFNGKVHSYTILCFYYILKIKVCHVLYFCFLLLGAGPPVDAVTHVISPLYVSMALYIAMSVWALLGIITTLIFLIFNFIFRKRRIVKLSSPNMNNLILLGCIACYTTVFFADIEETILITHMICSVRTLFLKLINNF